MARFALVLFAVLAVLGCRNENDLVADEFEQPILRLDQPAAAAWVGEGELAVSGLAHALDDVTVNRSPAELDGDDFTSEILVSRGVNLVEVRGVDGRGDEHFERNWVIAGQFEDPGHPVEDAGTIRVNRGGLDTMLDAAAAQITAEALAPTLAAANPVYEDTYLFDSVYVRADINQVWFSPVSLEAEPSSGQLSLEARIPDLWVWVTGSGEVFGWDFSVDVWMWATRADILGTLTVGAANGKLVVELESANIELVGFGYDTSLLPGEIESWLFVETVREAVEDLLTGQIEEQVPALLEEQLEGLDLSYDTELLDRDVHVHADIASASVDRQGLQVGVDLDVAIPGDGSKAYAGYLTADGGAATISRTADVALSLHDDTFNRVLFEAWRSGLLDLSMSTEDGTLDPVMLAPLHATQGSLTTTSGLPPVIVEEDGELVAHLAEMEVVIETPDGELGTYMRVALGISVPLEIAVDNSVLGIDLGQPDLQMMVRDSDWGASNEATTSLVEQMLPLNLLLSLVGDLSFPLPSLAGIQVESARVDRDPSGIHTSADITLD